MNLFSEEEKKSDVKLVINDAFLAKRPLSYSSLKHFMKSPKHYIHYIQDKFVQTDQMRIGSAIDCKLLEPDNFDEKFMIANKPDLRNKSNKEKWQLVLIEANETKKTIITTDQMVIVKSAVNSVMDHVDTRILIEKKTKVQVPLKWIDKVGNLPIRGFVDFETKAWNTDIVVDLKTTNNADPEEFVKQAVKMYYHTQMATYLRGYERTQFRFPEFIFLCVETTEPFNVSINYCDSNFKKIAKDELLGTLKAFRYCIDNEKFDTGYEFRLMETMNYFSMRIPGYYKKRYEGYDLNEQ